MGAAYSSSTCAGRLRRSARRSGQRGVRQGSGAASRRTLRAPSPRGRSNVAVDARSQTNRARAQARRDTGADLIVAARPREPDGRALLAWARRTGITRLALALERWQSGFGWLAWNAKYMLLEFDAARDARAVPCIHLAPLGAGDNGPTGAVDNAFHADPEGLVKTLAWLAGAPAEPTAMEALERMLAALPPFAESSRRRDALARVGPPPARRSPPARTGRCRHGLDDARPTVGRGRARPARRQDPSSRRALMLDVDVGAPEQGHAGLEIHVGRYWTEGSAEGLAPLLDALVALGLAERERAEAAITLPGCKGPGGPVFGISHVRSERRRRVPLHEALSGRRPRHAANKPRLGGAGRWMQPPSRRSRHPATRRSAPRPGARVAHVLVQRPGPGARLGGAAAVRLARRPLSRALGSFADGRTVDAVADEAGLSPGRPRPRSCCSSGAGACRRTSGSRNPRSDPCAVARRPRTASLYLFPNEPVQSRLCLLLRLVRSSRGPATVRARRGARDRSLLRRPRPRGRRCPPELPRRRRADGRTRRDAIGVAAFRGRAEELGLRAHGGRSRTARSANRPVRSYRSPGSRSCSASTARARRRSGRPPVAVTAARAWSRTCARWRQRASGPVPARR